MPGSGLGLSIVRDVATEHGGIATARPRPGGGAIIGFTVAGGKELSPESKPQEAHR
jgi:two-component system sensor histidine kinase MprB